MFKEWLFSIANYLISIKIESTIDNGKRICSVLVILSNLYRIFIFLNSKDFTNIPRMFSMMLLKPNIDRASCEDLTFVLTMIPEQECAGIAEVLVTFANHIISKNGLTTTEWLYVIPIIHVLNNKIEPFQKPSLNLSDIKWTNDYIDLGKMKKIALRRRFVVALILQYSMSEIHF